MSTSAVTISAFGPLRAQVGGADVALGSRGQRAVLTRLLVARRRVVSTDLLIEDLWAGDPPPRALGALQVHVSNLRRALEPGRAPRAPATVLVSAPPGYALDLPDDAVDVWNFERSVGDGMLDDARTLWVDLPYGEVSDASWARPEITRLVDLYRTAVERRADAAIASGDHHTAVADLEAIVREAPDREESVRLLALALYHGGRQSDALAVLRRLRNYLADDMGVDPSPVLRQVESDILAHRVASPVVPDHRPAPRAVAPASAAVTRDDRQPENGRPADLRRLLADADFVEFSELRLAWIGGEAGEGKSTLAAFTTAALAERGWHIGWGRCPEIDGAPPAWAWTEVLRSLAASVGMDIAVRSRLAPLLPESPEDTAVQPFWLGKWVAEYVAEVARSAPTVVVIDDLHRGDALTVSILRQLASAVRTERIFVIATFRGSEITDDLSSAWATLVDVPSTRLNLTGLDREHIASVAAGVGLTDISHARLDLLEERTGGNPLFVRELSRLMVSEGTVAARDTVPTGLSDVLRRRLSRLPERTQKALRTLSVLGRGSDLDTVLALTGDTEDRLLDDLEPAVLAGLLTEPTVDHVQFTHALVRDTLYLDIPAIRRRRAHATALNVVRQRFAGDLAAQAHHAALGATPATAREWTEIIVAAARRAETLGSHTEALALWNSAIDTLTLAIDPDPAERVAVLIPLVSSLARSADTQTARARRREAIDIATDLGDRTMLVDAVTSWRAPVIWHIRGAVADDGVLGPVRVLLEDPTVDNRSRALLLVTSVFEIEGLDSPLASAQALEAVALAEQQGDPEVLCITLNAFGYIAFGPDHDDQRVARATQLLSVATEYGFAEYQALAHFQLFLASNAVVDFVAARAHLGQAVRFASGAALTQLLGVLAIFGGLVDVLAGRTDSASARYDAVADFMDEQGTSHGFEIRYIGKLAAAMATDSFHDVLDDFESLSSDLPIRIHNVWALALTRCGLLDRAREIWAVTEPYQRDYYWRGMTAVRAHAAAALNDLDVCRESHDHLLPFAGTFAGVDSGSLYCGPVDAALAATAEALGLDCAAEHRRRADELIAHTKSLLADPGWIDQH